MGAQTSVGEWMEEYSQEKKMLWESKQNLGKVIDSEEISCPKKG